MLINLSNEPLVLPTPPAARVIIADDIKDGPGEAGDIVLAISAWCTAARGRSGCAIRAAALEMHRADVDFSAPGTIKLACSPRIPALPLMNPCG
jgi:hypothetical protein